MDSDAFDLKRSLFSFAGGTVDKIGVATVSSFDGCPAGMHPRDLLPSCRSVISFCVKHLDIFAASRNKDCQAYSQDLSKYMMMHAAYGLSRFMEREGYRAFPVTGSYRLYPGKGDHEGRISLRHAAQQAGLGHISRIGILLTSEYGPRIQLGAILTDAALPPCSPLKEDPCIGCDLCIRKCPTGAIRMPGEGRNYEPVDSGLCLGYRRVQGGSSPLGYRDQCGLCRAVCPVGR